MVSVSITGTKNHPPVAAVDSMGEKCWITITQGNSEIVIYAEADKRDALDMIADVFNDAFTPGRSGCGGITTVSASGVRAALGACWLSHTNLEAEKCT